MNKPTKIQKLKRFFQNHVSDSTAMNVVYTPIAAGIESFIARMPNSDSADARFWGAALTYAGMGLLYSKGLHLSRKIFDIKREANEKVKQLHDTGYGIAYSLVMNPLFYYGIGIRDWNQIIISSLVGTGLSFFVAGPIGYSIDAGRDLVGLEDSERIPRRIANLPSKSKKGLAALLVASSIGLTAGVYQLRTTIDNYLKNHQQNPQRVEQVQNR